MAGEWQTARIEEVAERVAMGPFGSSIKVETFVSEGVPVISGQHLHGSRVDDKPGFNFITQEHAEKLRNANVQRGDVIFTHRGTIGQVSYIPSTSAYVCYVISQSQFFLRPDKNKVLPEFLVAYFRSPEGQHKLLANTSQVGVPSIAQPVTYLRSLEIPLPPLPEQRAIAHILGTLDDKIELNRRMSETLEAMARALFKSWFVDFDPVRAKAEGRDPGLPKPLADLFPARLVDSELGEIPEGWEVATLESLASIQGGKQLPTEECKPYGTFPVYGANGIMGFAERATHHGFVMAFGRVGAYCGSVHWTYGGAWINNNASSVVPLQWVEYVLQVMLTADFEGMRTGSAQPFIPNSSLASLLVIRPSEEVLDRFCSIVAPLRLQEQATAKESRTLAALRDTLLPKLISGELRVKDAEKFIGRAV